MTAILKVRRSPDGPIEDVLVEGPAGRWVDDRGRPLWDSFTGQYGVYLRIDDEIVILETAVDVPDLEST